MQKTILELNVYQREYTAETLLNKREKITIKSVSQFYTELIVTIILLMRGNRRVYMDSLNSFKTFSHNNLNILFSDITVEWLKRYEKWLRSKDVKETSISLLFRTLRSAYNKAIEAKNVKKSSCPFDEYRLNKLDVSTEKRAISKEDIYKIMQVDLSNELFYARFSRDLFIFSYFCAGINLTDVANLNWSNILNNRLVYTRQKTGKR